MALLYTLHFDFPSSFSPYLSASIVDALPLSRDLDRLVSQARTMANVVLRRKKYGVVRFWPVEKERTKKEKEESVREVPYK